MKLTWSLVLVVSAFALVDSASGLALDANAAVSESESEAALAERIKEVLSKRKGKNNNGRKDKRKDKRKNRKDKRKSKSKSNEDANSCPGGQEWSTCTRSCKKICGKEAPEMCMEMCGPPGCDCPGTSPWFSEATGECFDTADACPAAPEQGSSKSPCEENDNQGCEGACIRTCSDPKPTCNLACAPAECGCSEGHLFDEQAQECVPAEECDVPGQDGDIRGDGTMLQLN